MTTIQNINQFKPHLIEKIIEEVKRVSGKLLLPTVSLCEHCHYHVPAYRYELDNKVYICKNCVIHGFSHNQIESDAEFYHALEYSSDTIWNFNSYILTEVTDRCNLECPHCYHLPDNKLKDEPLVRILERVKQYHSDIYHVVLAGAESSLRKDINDLVTEIYKLGRLPQILTNGVRFADTDFVKGLSATNAGMTVSVGLNHPSYLKNETIRNKQIKGILNARDYLNALSYVGYTMVALDELDYILKEITTSDWCDHYRIRSGSEIGRNATEGPIFVSNVFKAAELWAKINNQSFEVLVADNNIYHIMVKIGSKYIRLIHWCDETNIDMEELRTGPWCDFSPDGNTNFLHQVIRRDVWKNNKIILPDTPPKRYQLEYFKNTPPVF